MLKIEGFQKKDFFNFKNLKFLHTDNLKYKIFNCDTQNIKLCVVTSKKIGKACIRNKLRRKVKESIRVFFIENPELNSKAILIIPKYKCINTKFNFLKNEISKIFN